jgi:hypothetical protein
LPLFDRHPRHLNVVDHTDPFAAGPSILDTDTPPLARMGLCPVDV